MMHSPTLLQPHNSWFQIEGNRKRLALKMALSRHDVTILAERRRRHLLSNLSFGSGCRCCYDPNADGGEYRALVEAREKQAKEKQAKETEEREEEISEPPEERENENEEEDDGDEFDYLLDEDLPVDNGLKELEERRRAELEFSLLQSESALQHGYGTHRQLHPNRVLKAAGLGATEAEHKPPVVLHLVDPDSDVSAALDLFLETLSQSYRGTKFMRSWGRSTLLLNGDFATNVLSGLKPDDDMPALVAIRNGSVVATSVRLRELKTAGGELATHVVESWLRNTNVLEESPPAFDELCRIRPEEDALLDNMMANKTDQGERYDCGVPTCHKTFPHEHVGIQNSRQDGILVTEEQVNGI
mmetsp:Transcript_1861/g.4460  ORF Transcript_1861/g.4460 Transcript_1861/m.4460 type:complete len:358 (+) Transcript_1861:99-1172(+)